VAIRLRLEGCTVKYATSLSIPFRDMRLLITKNIVFGLLHDSALVLLEFPRGNAGLENLIQLFK
jgi:hypothetical protein